MRFIFDVCRPEIIMLCSMNGDIVCQWSRNNMFVIFKYTSEILTVLENMQY